MVILLAYRCLVNEILNSRLIWFERMFLSLGNNFLFKKNTRIFLFNSTHAYGFD
jgi:hypothetical protein